MTAAHPAPTRTMQHALLPLQPQPALMPLAHLWCLTAPARCHPQVDPLAPQPHALDLLEVYRRLQVSEKAVLTAVRDSEWESRQIARSRAQQEQAIVLEARYYDVVRLKVRPGGPCRQKRRWRLAPTTYVIAAPPKHSACAACIAVEQASFETPEAPTA